MDIQETLIPGCFEVVCDHAVDARGRFVKLFHEDAFRAAGLRTDWREEYYSTSARGVLRGMHFQAPPHDHAKLVSCLRGSAHDVVVDLRHGSPAYGRCHSLRMDESRAVALYIPAGVAHGFLALEDHCLMHYKVTSMHAAAADFGIRWDSLGHAWPLQAPLLSERDGRHPALADFDSPFRFVE